MTCPICNPETDFDRLCAAHAALAEKVDRILSGLEAALDAMEKRFTALEERIDFLEGIAE